MFVSGEGEAVVRELRGKKGRRMGKAVEDIHAEGWEKRGRASCSSFLEKQEKQRRSECEGREKGSESGSHDGSMRRTTQAVCLLHT